MRLLLGLCVLSSVLAINAASSNRYTASRNIAFPNQLEFHFTGNLNWGERIGVFTSSYTCSDKNQDPILEIQPSVELKDNQTVISQSPQTTSGFAPPLGDDVQFQLCYCNFVGANTICNRTSYDTNVGQLHVFNGPYLSTDNVGPANQISKLEFEIVPGGGQKVDNDDKFIFILPVAGQSIQCGKSSAAATATLDYGAFTTSSSVIDNKVTLTTALVGSTPVPAAVYRVCYCSKSLKGSACGAHTSPADYNLDIGEFLVHDLALWVDDAATEIKPGIQANNETVSFSYSSPVNIFTDTLQRNKFWFAMSNVSCGLGTHSTNTPYMTQPYFFPPSQQPSGIVDFSTISPSQYVLRTCLLSYYDSANNQASKVIDLSNVGVFISDITVPNRNIFTGFTDSGTAANNPLVPIEIGWSNSLNYGDKAYWNRQGLDCSQTSPATESTGAAKVDLTFPQTYLFDFRTVQSSTSPQKARGSYHLCIERVNGEVTNTGILINIVPGTVSLFSSSNTGADTNKVKNQANQQIQLKVKLNPSSYESDLKTNDKVWFRRVNVACGDPTLFQTVGSDLSDVVTVGTASNTDEFTLAMNFQYVQVDPVYDSNSEVDVQFFRLCVKQNDAVHDHSYLQVRVVHAITPAPTSTPVTSATTIVTPVSSSTAQIDDRNQLFEVNAYSTSPTAITWKFRPGGLVYTTDMIGFFKRPWGSTTNQCKGYYDSDPPDFYVKATQSPPPSGSLSTTAYVSGLAPGKYLVCYCSSGPNNNLPARDCSEGHHWNQIVGTAISAIHAPKGTYAVGYSTSDELKVDVSAQRLQQLSSAARLMLVPSPVTHTELTGCGKAWPTGPNLHNTAPTVDTTNEPGILTYSSFTWGYYGKFEVCFCEAANGLTSCPLSGVLPNTNADWKHAYGGPSVGYLLIHSVKLISKVSLSTSVKTYVSDILGLVSGQPVSFDYQQGAGGLENTAQIWFVLESYTCEQSFFSTVNASDVLSVPQQPNTPVTFNFGSAKTCGGDKVFRLCSKRTVQAQNSNGYLQSFNVYEDYKNVRVVYWDLSISNEMQKIPLIGPTPATIKVVADGIAQCGDLPTNPPANNDVNVMYFVTSSATCEIAAVNALPGASPTSSGTMPAANSTVPEHTGAVDLKAASITWSFGTPGIPARTVFRLCSRRFFTETNADMVIDFPQVQIVPKTAAITLAGDTAGAWPTADMAAVPITVTYNAADILTDDKIFFRRYGLPCCASSQCETGTTGTPAISPASTGTPANWDFTKDPSAVSNVYRMCVLKSNKDVIPFDALKVRFGATAPPTAPTTAPTLVPTNNPTALSTVAFATFNKMALAVQANSAEQVPWITTVASNALQDGDTLELIPVILSSSLGASTSMVQKSLDASASPGVFDCDSQASPILSIPAGTGNSPVTSPTPLSNLPLGMYAVCFCPTKYACRTGTKSIYGLESYQGTVGFVHAVPVDPQQSTAVSSSLSPADIFFELDYPSAKVRTSDSVGDEHVGVYISTDSGGCNLGSGTLDFTQGASGTAVVSTTLSTKLKLAMSNIDAVGVNVRLFVCACFGDQCRSWDSGSSGSASSVAFSNANFGMNFAQIGIIYGHDLALKWGTAPSAQVSSAPASPNVRVTWVYTPDTANPAATGLTSGSVYRFVDSKRSCNEYSLGTAEATSQMTMPNNNDVVQIALQYLAPGQFYRLCVKPSGETRYKDFRSIGVFVTDTDVFPKVVNVNWPHQALLNITMGTSLRAGDIVRFVLSTVSCPPATADVGKQTLPVSIFESGQHMFLDFKSTASSGWIDSGNFARMCVQTVDDSTGKTKYLDFNNIRVFAVESDIVITPKPLEFKPSITATFSQNAPNYFSATNIWLLKASVDCDRSTWSNNVVTPAGSAATVTSTNTISSFVQAASQDVVFTTLGSYNPDNVPWRLCVSSGGDLYDFIGVTEVTFIASRPPTATPTPPSNAVAPTFFTTPLATPNLPSSFSISSNPESHEVRQLLWTFTGTVYPGDMVGVGQATTVCGVSTQDFLFKVKATNTSSAVTQQTYTSPLPVAPQGKYQLCFCSAQSSNDKCESNGRYSSSLGSLVYYSALPSQTISLDIADSSSGFSLQFPFHPSANDRLMFIESGGSCGTAQPAAVNSALAIVYPTVNDFALVYGAFAKSSVGIFDVCFCAQGVGSNCFQNSDLSGYGGKVATALFHDFKFNGGPANLAVSDTKNITINVSQTLFAQDLDEMWFSKTGTACGSGMHTASSSQTTPRVISSVYVADFSQMTPASVLYRLCVKVVATGVVWDIDSAGVVVHDVSIPAVEQRAPERSSSSKVRLSYTSGLLYSSDPPGYNYIYWKQVGKSCSTDFNRPAQDYTAKVQIQSFAAEYTFNFANAVALTNYRLCAIIGGTTLDYSNVVVTPVQPLFQVTGGMLKSATNTVSLRPATNQFSPGDNDKVWFRRIDKACQSTVPQAGSVDDKYGTVAFTPVYQPGSTSVPTDHLELTTLPFRMCVSVGGQADKILDYTSVQTFLVSFNQEFNVCSPPSCNPNIYVVNPANFSKVEQLWWVQVNSPCGTTIPTQPTAQSSRATSVYSVSAGFEFSPSSYMGPQYPYRLCASTSTASVISDFKSVTLVLQDTKLHPVTTGSAKPLTPYALPVPDAVISFSFKANSMFNTSVWWQRKGDTCEKQDAGAHVSGRALVPTQQTYADGALAGYQATFDFSTCVTSEVPVKYTLCVMGSDQVVYSYTNVEIDVFHFKLTPAFVPSKAIHTVKFEPAGQFETVYFRQAGLACLPVPSFAGQNNTNAQLANIAERAYDFSKISSTGEKLRVCGVKASNLGSSNQAIVEDLPRYGVYIGDVQVSPVSAEFVKKEITITHTNVFDGATDSDTVWFQDLAATCQVPPTGGSGASSSTNAIKADTIKALFDFTSLNKGVKAVKLCASVKGVLQDFPSVTLQMVTPSPTVAPTKAPTEPPTTAGPTQAPTTKRPTTGAPTAAPELAYCQFWRVRGYCETFPGYMNQECPRTCAADCLTFNDSDKSCPGWFAQGLCSSNDFVASRCTKSCCEEKTDCRRWASSGYCLDDKTHDFLPYMKQHCPRACQWWQEQPCEDKRTECPGWLEYCVAKENALQNFEKFMRQNCQKTCSYCPAGL